MQNDYLNFNNIVGKIVVLLEKKCNNKNYRIM
jgi:hypothetical protein